MSVPLRIGVFGGTFNPIHVCHLRIAARVLALLALDRVVFVPASVPPHKAKEDLAPAHHRLEMVRLAVAGWPGFEADDLELARPGPSYSADTMEEFRRRYPDDELYFLMGIEMFIDLATWREPHRLLAACRVAVTHAVRETTRAEMPLPPLACLKAHVAVLAEQPRQRRHLRDELGHLAAQSEVVFILCQLGRLFPRRLRRIVARDLRLVRIPAGEHRRQAGTTQA